MMFFRTPRRPSFFLSDALSHGYVFGHSVVHEVISDIQDLFQTSVGHCSFHVGRLLFAVDWSSQSLSFCSGEGQGSE